MLGRGGDQVGGDSRGDSQRIPGELRTGVDKYRKRALQFTKAHQRDAAITQGYDPQIHGPNFSPFLSPHSGDQFHNQSLESRQGPSAREIDHQGVAGSQRFQAMSAQVMQSVTMNPMQNPSMTQVRRGSDEGFATAFQQVRRQDIGGPSIERGPQSGLSSAGGDVGPSAQGYGLSPLDRSGFQGSSSQLFSNLYSPYVHYGPPPLDHSDVGSSAQGYEQPSLGSSDFPGPPSQYLGNLYFPYGYRGQFSSAGGDVGPSAQGYEQSSLDSGELPASPSQYLGNLYFPYGYRGQFSSAGGDVGPSAQGYEQSSLDSGELPAFPSQHSDQSLSTDLDTKGGKSHTKKTIAELEADVVAGVPGAEERLAAIRAASAKYRAKRTISALKADVAAGVPGAEKRLADRRAIKARHGSKVTIAELEADVTKGVSGAEKRLADRRAINAKHNNKRNRGRR